MIMPPGLNVQICQHIKQRALTRALQFEILTYFVKEMDNYVTIHCTRGIAGCVTRFNVPNTGDQIGDQDFLTASHLSSIYSTVQRVRRNGSPVKH